MTDKEKLAKAMEAIRKAAEDTNNSNHWLAKVYAELTTPEYEIVEIKRVVNIFKGGQVGSRLYKDKESASKNSVGRNMTIVEQQEVLIKVKREIKPLTLYVFGRRHGLTISIHERYDNFPQNCLDRYWASFDHAEVKSGGILTSTYGNGNTHEEALNNYAKAISGKLLVINAHRSTRKEILVPELIVD